MNIEMDINDKDFKDTLKYFEKKAKSIDEKYLKSTLRRKSKTITSEMKRNSHSAKLPKMIGVTSAKKKVPDGALLKVGVVKNDPGLFPIVSSYGLAAILEYGTEERFRKTSKAGLITGRISTGKIPQRRYAFLRKSWDSKVTSFQKETIDTLVKRLEKE